MIAMIETNNLLRSLYRFWGETFPTTWPTIYPGVQAEASEWSTWVELAVPVWEPQPRRQTGMALSRFRLEVHCFCRGGTGNALSRELVDAVQKCVNGSGFVIRDFHFVELPAIGFARLQEADVRDLSRFERTPSARPLQHLLVSVTGRAQATEW